MQDSKQDFTTISEKNREKEREEYFSAGGIEVDESYFGAKRVKGKRGRGAGSNMKIIRNKDQNKEEQRQSLHENSKELSSFRIYSIIKKLEPSDSLIYGDKWKNL